jgi:hypothetical protein
MPNGDFEGEQPTNGGEEQPTDGGEEQPTDGGEEQPTDGGEQPTDGGDGGDEPRPGEALEPQQQDFDVEAAQGDVLSEDELAELDRNMTADRKEFGPIEDETAVASVDTAPSDAEPTAPA